MRWPRWAQRMLQPVVVRAWVVGLLTWATGGWGLGAVGAQTLPPAVPALPACAAADATPPGATQLRWQVQPAPWRVGQPVVLTLRLCPAEAVLRAMDATMPEHRHGMNYQPQLKPLGEGLWQVQGVLLHMAGRWELRFDTEHQGRRETRRETLVLR